MPAIDTLSRCRHCGASLIGERKARRCPRCHPDRGPEPVAQLDLFSAALTAEPAQPLPASIASDRVAEPVEPAPVFVPGVVRVAPFPTGLPIVPSSAPARPTRARRSVVHYLTVVAGSIIVFAGLGWGGFQLWPRGPVERSIVQAIAALPHFVERTGAENPFDAIRTAGDSSPTFVDLNGDGLPDLVLGSRSGEILVYHNLGTARRPRFLRPVEDTGGLVATDTSDTVAFADLRGVHLPDAVNAGTNGALTYFQNRGTRTRASFYLLAPEADPVAGRAAPAQSYDWRPVFADLDGDGDLDLIIGTRDGTVLYIENRGTPRRPEFSNSTRINPFGLHGAGPLVSLAFGDLDGDGDLDAIAADAAGHLRYFENRGTPTSPKFVLLPPGALGLGDASPEATVTLVDLDSDGDLDCITGGADGRLRYFENLSTPVSASR